MNIDIERDVLTISSILRRVTTAYTYYLSDAQQKSLAPTIESLLLEKIESSKSPDIRITFYRTFVRFAAGIHSMDLVYPVCLSVSAGN